MRQALKRFLDLLAFWRRGRRPPPLPRDPYAGKPAPRRPQPKNRSDSVAVAEPD